MVKVAKLEEINPDQIDFHLESSNIRENVYLIKNKGRSVVMHVKLGLHAEQAEIV